MSIIQFTWDDNKNAKNFKKHKIWFEEAETVFFDEHALRISDHEHSEHEERWIMLGLSSSTKLLLVCHCYRENDEIIRLISARKATKYESKQYHQKKAI
jgi:uncharacterized protein